MRTGLTILIAFLLLLASCSPFASYVNIENNTPSIKALIEPGDKVRIITNENEKLSFVVVDVTEDAILGESDTVHFANISKLQKERVSGTKNFWLGNETVGEDLWMDGWCNSFEYSPEQKEWVCAERDIF